MTSNPVEATLSKFKGFLFHRNLVATCLRVSISHAAVNTVLYWLAFVTTALVVERDALVLRGTTLLGFLFFCWPYLASVAALRLNPEADLLVLLLWAAPHAGVVAGVFYALRHFRF